MSIPCNRFVATCNRRPQQRRRRRASLRIHTITSLWMSLVALLSLCYTNDFHHPPSMVVSVAALATYNHPKKRLKPLSLRTHDPFQVERELLLSKNRQEKYTAIIGSDDSGMGAIAGPVVTVSCCIPTSIMINSKSKSGNHKGMKIPKVNDSKKLSYQECWDIYQQVLAGSKNDDNNDDIIWSFAIRTSEEIDTNYKSVQEATLDAFAETIRNVTQQITARRTKTPKKDGNVKIYSIVDGHKSPAPKDLMIQMIPNDNHNIDTTSNDNDNHHHGHDHRLYNAIQIVSRPWKQADSVVYSVALASILARVIRHEYMQPLYAQYSEYEFENHGGYPTQAHIAALHQYGPTPIHRTSCQPVQNVIQTKEYIKNTNTNQHHQQQQGSTGEKKAEDDTITSTFASATSRGSTALFGAKKIGKIAFHSSVSRRTYISSTMAILSSFLLVQQQQQQVAFAMTTDPKTGIALPDKGEIESIIPSDWSTMDNPISNPQSLTRLDTTSDTLFYSDPRFVEHVDEQAVQIMTQYISNTAIGSSSTTVLDLCSSWTSHIDTTQTNTNNLKRVVGLGMNAKELQANRVLTEWTVQDLNENPILPYQDNTFDVVLLQLSIDYLTKPLQVCSEIGRVLRKGGTVHILFSNRLFLSKAVALWTGADDIDHAYTVAAYLYFANGNPFGTNIQAKDLSVRNKKGMIVGDPVYVVTGTKQ